MICYGGNYMNKTKIRSFAEWAREKLIADITFKAGMLGINENGIAEKLPQSTNDLELYDIGIKEYAQVSGDEIKQRQALVEALQLKKKSYHTYKGAFDTLIEEVAYTWFNRLIAIRFMEVNDYLPSGIRVLSSENAGKLEPDLVTNPFDAELDVTVAEQDTILALKDQNKSDELFRMLFIKQCNQLHGILPDLFESTNDYTELLLTISFTDMEGIVYKLVHDIDEDDFNVKTDGGQVEIIGWLYQYYISKKHDEIINIYKGTIKKVDIPAATQLFTTDWVVRYMVDNSLGKYWIERNPTSKLADTLEFFVTPKDGNIQYIDEKIEPTELTFFDPCMGSGHILVYAFDVLMEIYRECGYSDKDAVLQIIQHNLYGMDIDKRAYQLAYFAVMMKARSYSRRILTQDVSNNLSVVEESNSIEQFTCEGFTNDAEQNAIGEYLVDAYKDAQEIGTLQTITDNDYGSFRDYLLNLRNSTTQADIFSATWLQSVYPLMLQLTKQAMIMSTKYAVVCTNPPYMNKLEGALKKFVTDKYKPYSGDLFSVFMYRNFNYCKKDGYSAFMTPFVWMFIKTYEKLREYIINSKSIVSLIQMEYSAFEEATVPICSFILKNGLPNQKSLCFRLSKFKGGMGVQKQRVLEALSNKECGYFYEAEQSKFNQITGMPIAYWVSELMRNAFLNTLLYTYSISPSQNVTGNNSKYVHKFWEISKKKVGEQDSWIFYCKGGGYRKWWGNLENIVNWTPQARKIYQFGDGTHASQIINKEYWYKKGITWGLITSSLPSFRIMPYGATYDKGGSTIIVDENVYNFTLALLNSKIYLVIAEIFNPTLNFQVKDVRSVPLILKSVEKINGLTCNNINISKTDWDSFETSWEFTVHPLIKNHVTSIKESYDIWEEECHQRFTTLKTNEEELNRIFIDIYGLQDELTPDVEDKDVTVRKADLQRDIKSLISYAVGCMFGRYSLDVEGLAYAGDEWDESQYTTYLPDEDNCIPITDEAYFEDDVVGRFCDFIKTAFGEASLEDNLTYIAEVLSNSGNTSREVIRTYFLGDFIKDHNKIYQGRPIYWLFDSGKQKGFKALVYMHRWNADTTGHMRVEYLHRMQKVYEREIERMQETIDHSSDNREITRAAKRKEKLQKQLKETQDYDKLVAHLALSRIDIDLDDGVKVNHEKVQTSSDGKKMSILAKLK